MSKTKINIDNYKSLAHHFYRNPSCMGMDEYIKDLSIPTKITSQIDRVKRGNGNIRVLINYFITFYNVFDWEIAQDLMFLLSNEKYHSDIKTILKFINRLREDNNDNVGLSDEMLEKLKEVF